jgi:uncharacterized protein (DUF488 family)
VEPRRDHRAREAPVVRLRRGSAGQVFSVGHSTRTSEELIEILREAGVAALADVRAIPRSARHPQFNDDRLARTLADAGIEYHHLPDLGGRRRPPKTGPSRNTLWKVEAFRNYADYAETPAFAAALAGLERLARKSPTAYMCAEAVWWRCHRRLITDYLLARGWEVIHLLGRGQRGPASLTPGAIVGPDGAIAYPAQEEQPRLI